jgi:DNA-binding transcriptional MerR regulator
LRHEKGSPEEAVNQSVHTFPSLSLAEAKGVFGLTARALRLYEDEGLISAHRDRQNARQYDLTARRRLSWIAPLRRAGVSLADIRRVLDGGPERLRERAIAAVEARLRALEADVALTRHVLEAIRASEDHPYLRLAHAPGSTTSEDARLDR